MKLEKKLRFTLNLFMKVWLKQYDKYVKTHEYICTTMNWVKPVEISIKIAISIHLHVQQVDGCHMEVPDVCCMNITSLSETRSY